MTEYRDDYQDGRTVQAMSEVWECEYFDCFYTTNIVEDRRNHRRAHKDGIIDLTGNVVRWLPIKQ